MFSRLFHLPLESRDSLFIFGPRGTGKTSWLKGNLPVDGYLYFDLLDSLLFRTLHAWPETLSSLPPNYTGWIVINDG